MSDHESSHEVTKGFYISAILRSNENIFFRLFRKCLFFPVFFTILSVLFLIFQNFIFFKTFPANPFSRETIYPSHEVENGVVESSSLSRCQKHKK